MVIENITEVETSAENEENVARAERNGCDDVFAEKTDQSTANSNLYVSSTLTESHQSDVVTTHDVNRCARYDSDSYVDRQHIKIWAGCFQNK